MYTLLANEAKFLASSRPQKKDKKSWKTPEKGPKILGNTWKRTKTLGKTPGKRPKILGNT